MEIYQPMTPDKKIYKCSNFPPYYNVLLFIINYCVHGGLAGFSLDDSLYRSPQSIREDRHTQRYD